MSKDYQHDAACHVDGCHKDIFGAGLCSTHYQRKRRTGTTDGRVVLSTLTCTVDGCSKNRISIGLCRQHYLAKKRHGDPTVRLVEDTTGLTCEIDGCAEPVRAKRLCTNHYANFIYVKRTGLTDNIKAFIKMRNGVKS